MIKAEDLRVGDLVKVSCDCILPEGSVCVVTQINHERFCKNRNGVVTLRYDDDTDDVPWGVCCNSIEGIPLTPKILENNGWKLYEPSTKMYIKSNSSLAVCFPPHSDKVQVYYVVEHLRTIKYIHEFQHILWALGMDSDMKIPDERKKKDERMIQYFKDLAPFDNADELYEKYGFSHKDAIAWLEKHGGHSKFINGIQVGDKVTRNEDGVLVNLSQLNRVAKKQGEHNTTDKVESNFKVGDWVVYCNDDVDLITGIEENGYCINNSGYIPFICASDIRLWTIQDAKDGDVLFTSSTASHETFIFKNIDEKGNAKCYFAYDSEDGFREGKYHFIGRATKCKPATKEQHDLLFQKMHEAGYEWDADKKELRKIEQKPAWSEEDEEIYRKCICAMRASACGFPEEEKFVEQVDNWFKSLKDRYSWKPSEEQIESLESATENCAYSEYQDCLKELIEQLKKLKS